MTHLEFARKNKGWTQQTLGELPTVRIDKAFISYFENNRAIPSTEQAERLARALGVPKDILMRPVVAFMPEESGAVND